MYLVIQSIRLTIGLVMRETMVEYVHIALVGLKVRDIRYEITSNTSFAQAHKILVVNHRYACSKAL